MTLKAVLETLESVDEVLHEFYTPQEDGTYRLDVEGVEDTTGLRSAIAKERGYAQAAEEALKSLSEFTPDEVKLIKEGKGDAVMQARVDKLTGDYAEKLKQAEDAAAAATAKATKWNQRALDNAIRAEGAKLNIHASAVHDALLRGRELFTLDDEGNAVQMKDGAVVLGADGRTPYGLGEWFASLKEAAPHWFPAARNESPKGPKSVARSVFDSWSPDARMEHTRTGGVVNDLH